MAGVRRFYYVQIRAGGPRHIVFTPRARRPVEADRTECGLPIPKGAGWWNSDGIETPQRCQRCCK